MEASLTEAASQLAGVVAGGALTVLAALLAGRTAVGLFRPLREKLTRSEGWIVSYAIGSALLSMTVFSLCAAGWFYDATVLAVCAASVACWLRWGRWPWRPMASPSGAMPRTHLALLLLPAAAYGALYVVHTLAPETRTDAMGYHLGLVQRYYRAHGFVSITTNLYAHVSQGAEMLYLFAYAIGRESAAKVVHFSFLIASVGGILCLARRFRLELAGVFAAVLYFTCPVVIPDATSAYNDCVLAFALLMAFYVLALWWGDRQRSWLVLLGVLIGFAFAVKYTGVVAAAAAVAAALSVGTRTGNWSAAARGLAVSAAVALAIGLPWLAKSAILTGNPLAPFFNDWFRNPYISVEWEQAYEFAMRSYRGGPFDRWEQLLEAPFDLVRGERYAGSLGWTLLMAPIALLAWRRPFARALLAAAFVCALPWLANAGARFLIPSVLFGAFALGAALQSLPRRAAVPVVAALLAVQCVTSWPAHRSLWYYGGLWSVEGFPWRAAARLEPQKWHLARNVEFFLLADELDRRAGPEERVLSLINLPEAYFQAELLVSYQGLENQDLTDALLAPTVPSLRPDRALLASWGERTLLGLRVELARPVPARSWSVSEVRPLRDGEPLPRERARAFDAFPLPWHAGRAFDGSPFTLWSARERPAPGMFLEVRFDEAVGLDGIEIVHSRSAARALAGLSVAGLGPDGTWEDLRLQSVEQAVRPASMKDGAAAAAALLRRHRIRYVVLDLHPRDPYQRQALAIASDPGAWGLRRAFTDRSAMLFEVVPAAPREPARR